MAQSVPSGLPSIPELRWGAHLTQLYEAGDELGEVLVPFFKAGLDNNEQCLWVTGPGFDSERARSALQVAVPDFARREHSGQIDIVRAEEWYKAARKVNPRALLSGLLERENRALNRGYTGLRVNGNCGWVTKEQWPEFQEYERLVHDAARDRRMICLCSYCIDQVNDGSQIDIMARHDLMVSSLRPRTDNGLALDLRRAMDRQKRQFDLAMTASKMGTWRYTLADNICIYDENAQTLYGLSQSCFLHDEEGVKAKFHPDDTALMWSRVKRALDPAGDGHYDVEYRVKQPDGSWRWLSAWGLVEFEGEGEAREPIAIAGASRDLTEEKRIAALQQEAMQAAEQSKAAVVAEADALTRLNFASSRLLRAANLAEGLEVVLDGAIETMGASFGNVQLLDPHDHILRIAAQRGFTQKFLDHFAEVAAGDGSACGRALTEVQRIIVSDVEADPAFAPHREIARLSGFRAVQSTPLVGRDGTPLGMISTHFIHPHAPSDQDLRRLDLYTRQAADFIERCDADRLRALLVNELNHRVKNTLATVMALWQHTSAKAESLPAAKKSFEARLLALSQAHTRLGDSNWLSASLWTLVRDEFRPYFGEDGHHLVLTGPDLTLNARAALSLSLAFHELTTNAVKYGSLSRSDGKVTVNCEIVGDDAEITWQEKDGPAVMAPTRSGFGRFLIERGIVAGFRGSVNLGFSPFGVTCRIKLPLAGILAAKREECHDGQ